jgi:AP-1 complex subunit gamma-1
MYIVGLALCTLGNIASQEMARDLSPEVEKHLNNSNPYIRKKVDNLYCLNNNILILNYQAALCAVRILKKVPELVEGISPLTQSFLDERNHGVLLSGITVSIEICQSHPETLPEYRKVLLLN